MSSYWVLAEGRTTVGTNLQIVFLPLRAFLGGEGGVAFVTDSYLGCWRICFRLLYVWMVLVLFSYPGVLRLPFLAAPYRSEWKGTAEKTRER